MSATPRRWSFIPPVPRISRWTPPNSRPPGSARSWCGCRSGSKPFPTSSTISARRFAHRRRFEPCSFPSMVLMSLSPPADGHSSGAPLPTIAEMADWTAALLDAAKAPKARLVGHSMGSLIALETAARHPAKVSGLSLIGTAAAMTVGPDLLKAAEANDPAAIDMVSIWGLGFAAELGGSLAPGLWMHSGAQRVLQQCRPGVLFSDLSACNSYQNALVAAAQVMVPTTIILGERDMMTPVKAGKVLAAAVPNARMVVLSGAGHMMMVERPDELLGALQA